MMPPSCKIVRGGEISSIPAQELVKGDVVFIKMGDKVPADLVLFSASDVKVDNSSVSYISCGFPETAHLLTIYSHNS
jgi:sodium/potassium-transporting ATPase subunit alpha